MLNESTIPHSILRVWTFKELVGTVVNVLQGNYIVYRLPFCAARYIQTSYSIRRETVWCDDTGRAITRFVLRDPMLNNVGMARTLRDLRVNHPEARG